MVVKKKPTIVLLCFCECFCSCNLYKFCVMLFSMLGNKSKANNPLSPLFVQVIRGIPLGVGQIFACGDLGPSLLILGAVFLYSPLLAVHALLGSTVGTLTGWFQSVCSCGCVGGVGEKKVFFSVIVFVCASYKCTTHNKSQFNTVVSDTGINLSAVHCMIHHLRAHHLQGTPKLHRKM